MRLNDPLTTSIFFDEKEYPLDLAFDNVLDVFDVLHTESLFITDKIEIIIALLIGENDLGIEEQLELWLVIKENYIFLNDSSEQEVDELGNPLPSKPSSKRMIDLEHDAKYIYSSFRQIGINLFDEQGKLSWEEFQALLESLPEDTIMQRIIQIRSWKPQKGMSPDEKKRMRELQKKYALPGGKQEEADE